MFGFGDKNNYNVNWTLRADVTTAIKNLTQYTNAVNQATIATERLQKASRTIKSGGGGGKGGGAATGGSGTSKSTHPSMSNQLPPVVGGGARGRVAVARGVKNPLRNTPFYGLMGTMMAYSALSSETKKAAEYSNIMTTSRAILRIADDDLGTFEERFDRLSKKVRQIGIETKFTATEVADATRYLAMAGLSMSTIEQSMKPISNLALIADEELGLIADLTTNIMTGYGLSENAMSPVADILTSTMTRSNVNIVELAESYKMSAGYLKSSGIDFAESAAAIGVLGNAGIKATMAGTALRAMAVRFAKPTTEATKTLDRLGVSFTHTIDTIDGQVNKVKPLVQIFTELRDAGATLEDMQRVFGTIGGNAAINLIANVEEIARIRDANLVAHGASEDVADAKKNTVLGRWASFTSTISDQFTTAFEAVEPLILQMLDNVIEYVQSPAFANGIQSLMTSIIDLFETVVRIFAWVTKHFDIIRPMLIGNAIFSTIKNIKNGVLGVVTSLREATTVMTGLSVAGGAIAVIASIAGVAAYETWSFYKANEAVFASIEKSTPFATKSFQDIADSIKDAVNRAKDLKDAVDDLKDKQGIEEVTGIKSSSFWANILGSFTLAETNSQEAQDIIRAGLNTPKIQQAEGKAIQDASQISKKIISGFGTFRTSGSLLAALGQYSNEYLLDENKINPALYDAYGMIRVDAGDKDAKDIEGTREYRQKFNSVIQETIEQGRQFASALKSQTAAWEFASNYGFSLSDIGNYTTKDASGKITFKSPTKDMSDEEVADLFINIDKIKRGFSALSRGLTDVIGQEGKANLFKTMGLSPEFWSLEPDKKGGFNINVNDIVYGDDDDVGGDGKKREPRTSGLTRNTAAPKQVIINIDNMMRVDNVDITTENKDEILEDIKQDVTQMLLDVAHDTSHSWLD